MKGLKSQKKLKIAMVGMYGGMWREFNPGCLVLGIVTLGELQRRLPNAKFDVYAIDNKGRYSNFLKESKDGLALLFFSKKHQKVLMKKVLKKYDAVIFGGDIIWGGDDVVKDNEIFFALSPKIPDNFPKKILFNAVHTFYSQEDIIRQKSKFINISERSTYISVRTRAIRNRLKAIGIKNAKFVPDPALLYMPPVNDRKGNKKKILGISVRYRLAEDLAKALPSIDFGNYEVKFLSYSRQYDHSNTVKLIKKKFKGAYTYDEEYHSPLASFVEIEACDALITDTYHGAIAAAVSGIPFISIDIEKEWSSRKQELISVLGLPEKNNIRLSYNNPKNHVVISEKISELLPEIFPVKKARLKKIRMMIGRHFDDMALAIELRP